MKKLYREAVSSSEIKAYLAEINPDALLIEQFEEALMGVVSMFGKGPLALYDKNKIISILMKDMSEEEAFEYFEYNIIGAYMENAPVFSELEGESLSAQQIVSKPRKRKPKINPLKQEEVSAIMSLDGGNEDEGDYTL